MKMNIPKTGQKVKFEKPTKIHWFTNIIENEKLLEIGKEYTVKEVSITSSASYLYLEDFWDNTIDPHKAKNKAMFSMHAFTWEPENLVDRLDIVNGRY